MPSPSMFIMAAPTLPVSLNAVMVSIKIAAVLFFIVDSATPIAVERLTSGYRNLESLRAFRDAAQAGDWQIELVLLQQDQPDAQANP